MSVEEPNTPNVRIRKKKVKRKSKDNGIVHLPVRAIHQRRCSSLTPTAVETQSKSRECCRHLFANFLKIPGCKLVCLRCILPQCYRSDGSDEDEAEARDEGYHSQNRRSSEILPTIEGATGGTEHREVALTAVSCENVMLIPPPRGTVNDYRKEPYRTSTDSPTNEITNQINWGITYIDAEVERVPQTSTVKDPNNILNSPLKSNFERKPRSKQCMESGYEVPIKSVLKESVKKDNSFKGFTVDYACVMFDQPMGSYDYNYHCGKKSNNSESKHYINEEVLHKCSDKSIKNRVKIDPNFQQVGKAMSETKKDLSFNATNQQNETKTGLAKHSENKISCEGNYVDTASVSNSHEYVNLKPLESKETNVECSNEHIVNELVDCSHMTECVGDNETTRIVFMQSKNKRIYQSGRDQTSNDYVNEFQNIGGNGKR